MESPYTDDKIITTDNLLNVCKYRQGFSTCRYITFSEDKDNYYCVKKITFLNEFVNNQKEMIAKGDNCQGLPL